ncbi:MAG: JDVT-CTERM system CAAX-type protease [Rubrivivax sp.]|nr:MAG: JDVT-CTERM system CAAX-type protease [Rubrivivax sp.]
MISGQALERPMQRPLPWIWAASLVLTAMALSLSPLHDLARALILLIAAPLTEEIIFRGGLQEALLSWGRSRTVSTVVSALAFGLAHVALRGDWQALAVALPALVIGAVYGQTRRLAPCVLLHMGMNACWLLWRHT